MPLSALSRQGMNSSRAIAWILAGVVLSVALRWMPARRPEPPKADFPESSGEGPDGSAGDSAQGIPTSVVPVAVSEAARMAMEDPPELSELGNLALWIPENSDDEALETVAQVSRAAAMRDPRGAAGEVPRLPPGRVREVLLEQVTLVWSESDFSSARDWALGLEDAREREAVLLLLASERLRVNPCEAVEIAAAQAPAPGRDDVLIRALQEWIHSDYEAAARWCDQASLSSKLLAGLTPALAEAEPRATVEWIVGRQFEGSVRSRALAEAMMRWEQQDPDAVALWASRNPGTGSSQISDLHSGRPVSDVTIMNLHGKCLEVSLPNE